MQLVIASKMMFYSGIHSCMTILVVKSTTAMARSVMQVFELMTVTTECKDM